MFRIKICGVTTVEDAILAAEAGADAIGLNFYPRSPRCISPAAARRIAESIPGGVLRVGVLVNPTEQDALDLVAAAALDAVQLHGDEPPGLAACLSRSVPVIKVFRMASEDILPVVRYLEQFRESGGVLRPVLFDAYHPSQFGGIGKTANWAAIQAYPTEQWHPPFILAGGLTAENVAAAIHAVSPAGVDTASGVEQSPGRKDPERVVEFVRAAKQAFDAVRRDRT